MLAVALALAVGGWLVYSGLRFEAHHWPLDLVFVLLGLALGGAFASGAAREPFLIEVGEDGLLRFTALTWRRTVPVSELHAIRLAADSDGGAPTFGAYEFRWRGGCIRVPDIPGLDALAAHLQDRSPGLRVIDERGVYPGDRVSGFAGYVSPPGSYAPDPAASGASTVFVESPHRVGTIRRPGQIEVRFREADLRFSSTSVGPATFAGGCAACEGTGTVNGAGGYGCVVTVAPSGRSGAGSTQLRVRIWDRASGLALYDTQPGHPLAAGPPVTTANGGITVGPPG